MTTGVLSASQAAATADADLTLDLFLRASEPAKNLRAAGCLPVELTQRGATSASALRALGFDAYDLLEPSWLESAISAYGASDVRSVFVVNETDAVSIAGTHAAERLGCTPAFLLGCCEGSPTTSIAVLTQYVPSKRWNGVGVDALLASGVQYQGLVDLGLPQERLLAFERAAATRGRARRL
jgi:hypothetical protein